ncbi:MAG: alanine--tRNA ligase, partial [Candidatus Omnitrophica bacterium]|nr:alanine--tRNA ligase [Candidatus Omnitrophota bacterium]
EDPSLLFTSAGMVQFKKFWATEIPLPFTRATSCQKCLRAGGKDSDLEKIGLSGKHHTFFEMLGNFSFGDYFKEEAIHWAWEFVTGNLKINSEKLWVSYYSEDNETLKIWRKLLLESRIVPLGKKDNFWGPAGDTGPCGPCTEIYIELGVDPSCNNRDCKPGCDCNRFLEFWNLVFPQYNQQADGTLQPLKRRGVDTGMGLERIARIMQGKNSNFETDLFIPLMLELERISGLKYDNRTIREFRIIADHIRAAAFLITDGVYPDNEGRGYVLKRIIRRAYFQGTRIGLKEPFLTHLITPLASTFENVYQEIRRNIEEIKDVIYEEEKKFSELLSSARKIFRSETAKLSGNLIPGDILFRWYDTYGIPRDLISDLAEESNLQPEWHIFEQSLKKQQEQSRQSSVFVQKRQVVFDCEKINETTFTGYQTIEDICKVIAFYHLPDRNLWELVLDRSPFYPEKGGQAGDKGIIKGEKWRFEVIDSQIDERGIIFHIGKFAFGQPEDVQRMEEVVATVSRQDRMDVSANHTATHLIHFYLRKLSNNQAKQSGSYVGTDKLRFDFIYPEPLNQEIIEKLETDVNKIIFENHPVKIEEMDYQQAIKNGAIALFTEKYGKRVRVVKTGNFHAELCGGTHVLSTSEIGLIKITSFSSIGENLKRIEAVTRESAYNWFKKHIDILLQASNIMKTSPENLSFSINKLKKQLEDLEKRIDYIIKKSTLDIPSTLKKNKKDIQIKNQVVHIIAGRVDGVTIDHLGKIADKVSSQINNAVVFLAGTMDKKAVVVCKVTPDISNIIQAQTIMKHAVEILNGSGGGKPEFARGSGKDITKVDETISRIHEIISDIYGR